MPAAGQQLERMTKFVGEDEPVGYPRHGHRLTPIVSAVDQTNASLAGA